MASHALTGRSDLVAPLFSTFEGAYVAVLREVVERHPYRNAPRGNQSRECLNVGFRLADPRDRATYLPARRANIVFHWAEALWYVWARNDLDMIAYYAPRIRAYSSDGKTLTGSAYGRRLFSPLRDGMPTVWTMIQRLLHEDPDSKRGVATFFQPEELAVDDNPDVACIVALQFFQRERRLHAVAYMRANDAVQGLLSDVFSFTLIQELMARELGVELATYAHHVGSMHIGEPDLPRVERVLADVDQGSVPRSRYPLLTMPREDVWENLRVLEDWERRLRLNEGRLSPARVQQLGLAPYWQQVALLFEAYRQIVHQPDRPMAVETLDALSTGNRWLLAHRWPKRMPHRYRLTEGSLP